MAQLAGKVAWITGGGTGIGAAGAAAMATDGAQIILSGRRAAPLRQVAEAITAAGGSAIVEPLDVADAAAVQAVADRIAANGDVADKIGTYSLAVLADANGVPMYVAAPTSTVDMSIPTGDDIPIEERPTEEVTHLKGVRIPPEGIAVANTAFDVTPHRYVTAIVTEMGVVRQPYEEGLKRIMEAQRG